MQRYAPLRLFTVCLWLLAIAGCTVSDIRRQAIEVESANSVTGKIDVQSNAPGKVFVQAYRYNDSNFERIRHHPIQVNGEFQMNLFPGTYALSAFIDENNNGEFDAGEHGYYPGMENRYPQIYEIREGADITMPTMIISGATQSPSNVVVNITPEQKMKNTGTVISLDNPMFDDKTARMALLKPVDFAQKFGGGVMFLQPYDDHKIPLLFVHGIGGSAREFRALIDSIDHTRFQPWVYQYASGKPLSLASDFLGHALSILHARHEFDELVLIAHSMGGLMGRDYVLKHAKTQAPYQLTMVMTINSPLLGMDSAEKGARFSPIVIPSWRDVASGSAFVQRVHASTWPTDVPYHLVFSYLPKKTGDGVVPVTRQLNQALQDEARIRGFEKGHATILRDGEFIDFFNRTLATVNN